MNYESLADELIETRCGTHSLGLIYEFLLRASNDANLAKAEFLKFISGELSRRLLEEARSWVAEEQEVNPTPQSEALLACNSIALPGDSRELTLAV